MARATDDERREVAERLRCAAEQGQPYTQPTLACFIGADCMDIWTRLADLIEPSDHIGDPDKMVDREALLALTRRLDARATDLLKTNSIDSNRRRRSARKEHAMDLMTACSLIREACVVVG